MATLKANPSSKCFKICFQVLLLLIFSIIFASAGNVITHLPGFDGELPFYLETGYIGVGESNESQLFYYFVESQRSPSLDPLMLWLTGGPGCSALSAFFYESVIHGKGPNCLRARGCCPHDPCLLIEERGPQTLTGQQDPRMRLRNLSMLK